MRKKSKRQNQQIQRVSAYNRLSAYIQEYPGEKITQRRLSIYEFLTLSQSCEVLDDAGLTSQLKDNVYGVDNYRKIVRKKYFLICNSCHWCASYFRNGNSLLKCPQCEYDEIECMPIGDDENYSFNYSPTKGVELEFSRKIEWNTHYDC